MADEPDDLEQIEEVDTPDIEPEGADDGAPDTAEGEEQPGDDDGEGYTVEIEGIADDAEETPLIKQMRTQMREKDREIAALRKTAPPAAIEVGEKPTLESCNWDEAEFETKLDEFKERKAASERQAEDARKVQEQGAQQFNTAFQSYRAKAAEMQVPDYEKIEARVSQALPIALQNGIVRYLKDKAPAVVLALDKHPALLAEIAAMPDPLEALFRLQDISKGIKVVQRRKGPEPDRPLRGSAPVARVGPDKRLADFEAKAARSGDRTELIAYKASLKEKAK